MQPQLEVAKHAAAECMRLDEEFAYEHPDDRTPEQLAYLRKLNDDVVASRRELRRLVALLQSSAPSAELLLVGSLASLLPIAWCVQRKWAKIRRKFHSLRQHSRIRIGQVWGRINGWQGMARGVFGLATMVSLLAFAAICTLWIRSCVMVESISATSAAQQSSRTVILISANGGLGVIVYDAAIVEPDSTQSFVLKLLYLPRAGGWTRHRDPRSKLIGSTHQPLLQTIGFVMDRQTGNLVPGQVTFVVRTVVLPDWFTCLLAAALPAFWIRLTVRRRRRRRLGLCARCGYDLRASFGRCPECGTVTSKRPSLFDLPTPNLPS
jgi:hypothetical protein